MSETIGLQLSGKHIVIFFGNFIPEKESNISGYLAKFGSKYPLLGIVNFTSFIFDCRSCDRIDILFREVKNFLGEFCNVIEVKENSGGIPNEIIKTEQELKDTNEWHGDITQYFYPQNEEDTE